MRTAIRPIRQDVYAVVLVASSRDWQLLRDAFPDLRPGSALGSEWTSRAFGNRRVVFVSTGEDTVPAAAIAQHGVDQWRPAVLLMPDNTPEPAAGAFRWVSERNRIALKAHASIEALIGELQGTAASVSDLVVPLPDGGAE